MKVRSDSEEQTVIYFTIVTATQLLNDMEPGRNYFPHLLLEHGARQFWSGHSRSACGRRWRRSRWVVEIPQGLVPLFNLSLSGTSQQTDRHTPDRVEWWEGRVRCS